MACGGEKYQWQQKTRMAHRSISMAAASANQSGIV